MKTKLKEKGILAFLNIAILIMSALIIIMIGLIIGNYYNEMKRGYQADRFLSLIKEGDYTRCVQYYYRNEKKGIKADDELLECYGVAKYFEAAYKENVYETTGELEKAAAEQKKMTQACQEMGALAPVKQKIDKILATGK